MIGMSSLGIIQTTFELLFLDPLWTLSAGKYAMLCLKVQAGSLETCEMLVRPEYNKYAEGI